jgi:hypothetical protein
MEKKEFKAMDKLAKVIRNKDDENPSLKDEFSKMVSSKSTGTAFILMFPAFILAIIASIYSTGYMPLIVVALSIYQFLLIKKFIEDYYKK